MQTCGRRLRSLKNIDLLQEVQDRIGIWRFWKTKIVNWANWWHCRIKEIVTSNCSRDLSRKLKNSGPNPAKHSIMKAPRGIAQGFLEGFCCPPVMKTIQNSKFKNVTVSAQLILRCTVILRRTVEVHINSEVNSYTSEVHSYSEVHRDRLENVVFRHADSGNRDSSGCRPGPWKTRNLSPEARPSQWPSLSY